MFTNFQNTIIVTGHYGCGKTNFSLNLAMDYRKRGGTVALADLDIVNPYFRSAEYCDLAEQGGFEIVASDYAGPRTSLDIPALTGRLDGKIGGEGTLIIDVGGDEAGAMVLGRYSERLKETGYTMLYLVNAYRYLVSDPRESLLLLWEIEAASRLRATHIVNNSNLGSETTPEDVRRSLVHAREVSELSGLPVVCTVASGRIAGELGGIPDLYSAKIYVKTPWNEG